MAAGAVWAVGVQETSNVLEFTGTVDPGVFAAAVTGAPAGPLEVRPTTGQTSFTVSGDYNLNRDDVTFRNMVIRDVYATNEGNGFSFQNCTVHSWCLDDVHDWQITNCDMPFNHVTYGPHPGFDVNGGCILFRCTNFQIVDSTFTGCVVDADPGQHTEAFFIGAGNNNGIWRGCSFDDNGTTAHLFFTWWDDEPNPPTNICVTECAFTNCLNEFFHTSLHPDLEGQDLNIRLDTDTCTFDASALWPMGNQNGEWTDWNLPCSTGL